MKLLAFVGLALLTVSTLSSAQSGPFIETFYQKALKNSKGLGNLLTLKVEGELPIKKLSNFAKISSCGDKIIAGQYEEELNQAEAGFIAIFFESSKRPIQNKYIQGVMWTSPLIFNSISIPYEACTDRFDRSISLDFMGGLRTKIVQITDVETLSEKALNRLTTVDDPALCLFYGKELIQGKLIPRLCVSKDEVLSYKDHVEVQTEGFRGIKQLLSEIK